METRIQLTYITGQKVEIDAARVLRIRRRIASVDGPKGNSRVVWLQADVFNEKAQDVAALVLPKLPTLVSLNMPDRDLVWLNGKEATGPVFVPKINRFKGVRSAVEIGKKLQLVSNTPQEVADVIKRANGNVLPIRDDEFGAALQPDAPEVWDADLYESS